MNGTLPACSVLVQNYPTPAGYAGDFANKNNAVIAFVIFTVLASGLGSWVAIESAASGKSTSPSFLPQGIISTGTSLLCSAVSCFTSFIAWVVYASIVADDRAFYGGSSAYAGGAEVSYSAGFALIVSVWITSFVCSCIHVQAIYAARANAAAPSPARAGRSHDFTAMGVEPAAAVT
jgi:hypothetical protein